jgi:hypothetical protein
VLAEYSLSARYRQPNLARLIVFAVLTAAAAYVSGLW